MSNTKDGVDKDQVGYRNPPASTRFRKGKSGNPRGRPRKQSEEAPFEAVLGQMVTVRENGVERQVDAAEAFLLYLTKKGLEGDSTAVRATLAAIEKARAARLIDNGESEIVMIVRVYIAPGSVNPALEPLRMAKKLDRYRETARMALEPWIVEAALKRLGDTRLTVDEQRTVVDATRTPWKVKWPKWWKVIPTT